MRKHYFALSILYLILVCIFFVELLGCNQSHQKASWSVCQNSKSTLISKEMKGSFIDEKVVNRRADDIKSSKSENLYNYDVPRKFIVPYLSSRSNNASESNLIESVSIDGKGKMPVVDANTGNIVKDPKNIQKTSQNKILLDGNYLMMDYKHPKVASNFESYYMVMSHGEHSKPYSEYQEQTSSLMERNSGLISWKLKRSSSEDTILREENGTSRDATPVNSVPHSPVKCLTHKSNFPSTFSVHKKKLS